MRPIAFAVLLAGTQLPADATVVQVRMMNNTEYAVDYSLQMAQLDRGRLSMPMFLGKELSSQISYEPILEGQGGFSPYVDYVTTEPGVGDDAISLNLRMRYTWNGGYNWDYKDLGMLSKIFGGPHVCDVHAGGPINLGDIVLLSLRKASFFWPYALSEILPNGDSCTFYISGGFGPVVWGPETAGPAPALGEADVPGVTRAMTGAELARTDPALHAQFDQDYLRATGIDLRAVRARNARPPLQPSLQ